MRDKINDALSAHDVKYGPAAKFTILPGEDPLEFDGLRKEVVEELAPDGPVEEDLVLTVAKCIWRKWRYQRLLAAKAAVAQFDPAHQTYNETLALIILCRLLEGATLDWEIQKSLEMQRKHVADHLETKCPKKEFSTPVAWRKALQKELREVLIPNAARFGIKPREALMMETSVFLTDDLLAFELECEEQIDRAKERALDRLAKLKADKRKGSFREAQRFPRAHLAQS